MNSLIVDDFELSLVQELYVGETKFVVDFLDLVSKARAPYVGKLKRPIKGNKDFIKIGDMIAEEFGFSSCTFNVPYDMSMNAFTYPITNDIDRSVVGTKPKFIKDTGMKYDKGIHRLHIIVCVTSGIWFNPLFTDREVVAAILHEVGHSFVTQSQRMMSMVECRRILLVLQYVYDMIIALCSMDVGTVINRFSQYLNAFSSYKALLNHLTRLCASHPLFAVFNGFDAISEWITGVFMHLLKEIAMLIRPAANLTGLYTQLVNAILTKLLLNPFVATARSQEYLSDSFAAMYGFGPELSSFLTKIGTTDAPVGTITEKIINNIPFIGALYEMTAIPVLCITNMIQDHPSTPARVKKMIDELEKEMNNTDLNPKAKSQLKKDLEEIRKVANELSNPPDNHTYNAEMVKRLWLAFLMNGGEIKDELEEYYTDLKARDKYVKEALIFHDIELI